MAEAYDLFVIGAGSGGVRAARFAARFGAKVGVAESGLYGGTCVHAGCVPKKLLAYGAEYAGALEDMRGYGWSVEGATHSWAALIESTRSETTKLGGLYRKMLVDSGCVLHEARATVVAPGEVEVAGVRHRAGRILVATGSHAVRLDVPGGELGITSDGAFRLDRVPRSVVVLGGGYIALEFAGIFRGLGADVTVVHRGAEILRGFDHDVRAHVRGELEKRGLRFELDAQVTRIARGDAGLEVHTSRGTFVAEEVLQAVGRRPNSAGIGLEEAGVRLGAHGEVLVSEHYETNVPGILAVGDVIGRVALTPVALAEGMHVARRYFGGLDPAPIDYDTIPTAVFCQPNVSTVGMTEETARARGEVRVYKATLRPMRNGVAGRSERALVKLVVDAASDRLLGAHVVGPDAGEIIQGFAVALTCGATKAQIDATIGIHPTLAEELVTLRG